MNASDAIFRAIFVVLMIAVVPAVVLLVREVSQRVRSRRALEQLAEARALFASLAPTADPAAIVGALAPRFDGATLERAMEAAIREGDGEVRRRAIETTEKLGLTVKLATRVREARSWSERAHAAEVLGLIGSPLAVPALVECLRDPYEDDASVKRAAATALARIREPGVIPLLVAELHTIDDWSSPRVADALVAFGSAATASLEPSSRSSPPA